MILALGPWIVGGEERRTIHVPFSAAAMPTLIMKPGSMKRIRFETCSMQGDVYLEKFMVDGEAKISGRCHVRDFVRLFGTQEWPLLGPGSKLDFVVLNPDLDSQHVTLVFAITQITLPAY